MLEDTLDRAQKESRALWQSKILEHDEIKLGLTSEYTAISELGSRLNRQMSRLHMDWMEDVTVLLQEEHERWLLSTGSREKEVTEGQIGSIIRQPPPDACHMIADGNPILPGSTSKSSAVVPNWI